MTPRAQVILVNLLRVAILAMLWGASGAGVASAADVDEPAAWPAGNSRQVLTEVDALAPGMFLVAGRKLRDPNFAQTVVLLLDYNAEGAEGLVINRATTMTVGDVLPDLEGPGTHEQLGFGGPVGLDTMALLVRARKRLEGAQPVIKQVQVTRDRALLDRLAAGSKFRFRAFAGYAGWAAGQLDGEVERGDWYLVRARPEDIFEADLDKLWDSLLPPDPFRTARWVVPVADY